MTVTSLIQNTKTFINSIGITIIIEGNWLTNTRYEMCVTKWIGVLLDTLPVAIPGWGERRKGLLRVEGRGNDWWYFWLEETWFPPVSWVQTCYSYIYRRQISQDPFSNQRTISLIVFSSVDHMNETRKKDWTCATYTTNFKTVGNRWCLLFVSPLFGYSCSFFLTHSTLESLSRPTDLVGTLGIRVQRTIHKFGGNQQKKDNERLFTWDFTSINESRFGPLPPRPYVCVHRKTEVSLQ